MSEQVAFGNPERFQIALRWVPDPAPPGSRPAGHGWSFGALSLTVGGMNLTTGAVQDESFDAVLWYLAPVLDWLATNWCALTAEEAFPWNERSALPAASACSAAFDRNLGASDARARSTFAKIQSWYRRHGLRSAAPDSLMPDVFLRRFGDDIEISWTSEPPGFAPAGFTFSLADGFARLPVEDVAGPLWDALQWAVRFPPADIEHPGFMENFRALEAKVAGIRALEAVDFDRQRIPALLDARVRRAFADAGAEDLLTEPVSPQRPYVRAFSMAALTFGGLEPNLSDGDIAALRDRLLAAHGGQDDDRLAGLVADRSGLPIGTRPYLDGYDLARDLLEDLDQPVDDWVDIRRICGDLEIEVADIRFDTTSIRGAAIAGAEFRPSILINDASRFNRKEEGRRFTIAHELCHILHDRTRARRLSHTSGTWAEPAVEGRANAFAAFLLMPRALVTTLLGTRDPEDPEVVRAVATTLRVGPRALVEHLYNMDLIDFDARELLREEVSATHLS